MNVPEHEAHRAEFEGRWKEWERDLPAMETRYKDRLAKVNTVEKRFEEVYDGVKVAIRSMNEEALDVAD